MVVWEDHAKLPLRFTASGERRYEIERMLGNRVLFCLFDAVVIPIGRALRIGRYQTYGKSPQPIYMSTIERRIISPKYIVGISAKTLFPAPAAIAKRATPLGPLV